MFCASLSKHKKNIRIGHIRCKGQKILSEQFIHPYEEIYDDLFTQDQKEVGGFYSDLYKERDTDHSYKEIIRALGICEVKLLTEAKLQLTEKPISTTELSEALKRMGSI